MIFITGAACSGKTSVTKLLKQQLRADKFDIHDIDEADKWTDDYESWRDAKVEHWLQQSIKNRQKGIETILCGIIYPEDVVKAPSYAEAKPIKYFLLDATAETIRNRYNLKMEPWLNRQTQVAAELKNELQDKTDAQLFDTNDNQSQSIADLIARSVL